MAESDDQSSIRRFSNPALPFAADIPGDVFPGKVLLIKLVILEKARCKERRLTVDLCCGRLVHGDHRDNKALHFNARFDTSCSWFSKPDRDIVLNSLINNVWGPEQRVKNCFEIGKPTSIRILMLRDYFKIAINGIHLCDYIYRLPIDDVCCLYVDGCAKLSVIEFQGEKPALQPIPSVPDGSSLEFDEDISLIKPNVPVIYRIHGGFTAPRSLHLVVTPKMDASQFAINFIVDSEYLLHIRVDFPHITSDRKGAIVRNSTRNGIWLTEERQMNGKFPFMPGITSDIHIISETTYAKIIMGGNLLDIFQFRTGTNSPLPLNVNQINVTGDFSVQAFEFKTSV